MSTLASLPKPVQVHLDAATHTYYADGQVVPGVTNTLKEAKIVDYSMIRQDVLQAGTTFMRPGPVKSIAGIENYEALDGGGGSGRRIQFGIGSLDSSGPGEQDCFRSADLMTSNPAGSQMIRRVRLTSMCTVQFAVSP